ncbi:cob(I)yrinic acid a,c-diamide adenosyltransferase [Natranaerovirga hydrolytica]|uniref:Cob(I)yrinic acid a,c-diamide adenosyltransferase n=1 Tax=Natranaerovirga hydrolytica TaxID=680378 RepID=A0A4R1MEP7_9FIRM|nr:cob(I)yrinic acid a,c-diamide adenosyltransferase [Natranaerovirga hydrolytica]TCK90617.1 cob(I)yrinic acid a,c-diamide adenosyltransferase [Natranaerovirga hydrolytica]
MKKGLTQVYCGTGKGKTTAAIGQGVRATGHGLKVIMIQFLKGRPTGEVEALKNLEPEFKVFKFEKQKKFFFEMDEEQKADLKSDIKNALNFAKKVLDTKECDVLILDEILGVIENQLFTEDEIINLIENKSDEIELIITGRILPERIKSMADYISTIEETKHPFYKGVTARKGIEY